MEVRSQRNLTFLPCCIFQMNIHDFSKNEKKKKFKEMIDYTPRCQYLSLLLQLWHVHVQTHKVILQ